MNATRPFHRIDVSAYFISISERKLYFYFHYRNIFIIFEKKIAAMEIIEMLELNMRRRLEAMPERIRPYTTEYRTMPKAAIIVGARGCGKSTFLMYQMGKRKFLYISLDNPIIASKQLYDIVSDVFMHGYDGVILDEVHYADKWSLHLKSLYDDFPGKYIWASDSSTLIMRSGIGDLSRRYVQIKMPMMSFREYLYLETGVSYNKYEIGGNLPISPDAALLRAFNDYRAHGTRPFYQEGEYNKRYLGILDKVLYTDIPFFLPSVTDNNLRLMNAIIGTLSRNSIPRVQVTSLCTDWAIGAEKLYQLLFVMENVDLLSIIRYKNDIKARSTGAKILFSDPCAYHVLDADKGTEREAFVAFCFTQSGFKVNAIRDERKGDFIVTTYEQTLQYTVEVGGEKKKLKGADYVLRDNTDFPTSKSIPFWLLAMMW